tara:strand:- start:551 stop:1153 length:603 start_codon:yes stop_codon:yes gene_type:complete
VEPHKLVPNPRNPNTHPDEQIRLLAKVIDYTGWRHPIVVSKRSGFIVEGHARLLAAQLWGYDVVPVHYQDWENEAREWADMLADNRLGELAEVDRTVLKDLIEEMDTGSVDMEVTGFTEQAIEDLMTAVAPRPDQQALIDEFTPPDIGNAKGDGNWFYVEFYGKDKEFAELKALLGDHLETGHVLNNEFFARLVRYIDAV